MIDRLRFSHFGIDLEITLLTKTSNSDNVKYQRRYAPDDMDDSSGRNAPEQVDEIVRKRGRN